MLDKALGEVEASRIAIKALQDALEAQKREKEAYLAVTQAQEKVIALQEKHIDRLNAVKCSKISFLFILTKKTCY